MNATAASVRVAARVQTARSGERLWIGGLVLAVLVACALPYIVAAQFGRADLERLGTFWFSRDFSQYQAAMREGAAQSGWLIHDHFSAEPHSGAFMYPLYVGAGKLAAALGIDPLAVFTTLEWLGRVVVVGAVYAFAATFVRDARPRRLAVLVTLATLGLDIWAVPLRLALETVGAQGAAALLPDLIDPYLEVSSFGVLLSAPHLMFGLALTLVAPILYLRAIDRQPWALLGLGCAAFALSLVHSFNTPVLASVLLMHAALTGRQAWLPAVLAAGAMTPMALYSLMLFSTDPFWSGTYGAQNTMPAPPPWQLPIDFGLVLIAAPLGWHVARRWPTRRKRLLLLWIALGLLWMYVPVPYQRRFAFGVQPALGILAGIGLVDLNAWMRTHQIGALRRRLVNYGAVLAAMSTSLFVYVSLLSSAAFNQPADVYLWSRAEAAAAAWLAEHSSAEDVVLASTDFANPLAGRIDGRVVHGHVVATLHSDTKAALVRQFYSASATPEGRSSVVRESQATVVALGPRERALGAVSLSDQPRLALVYARDGVELYRVVP